MAKKNDMSNIANIGLGIMDTLTGITEERKKEEHSTDSSGTVKEEGKSDAVNTPKSKGVKEVRSKRSFMLTDTTIQRLNLLRLCMNDKDLSSIVEESIELYFNNNKKQIESLIELYEKIK